MSCGSFQTCENCVKVGCTWVLQSLSSWCTKDLNGIVGEFSSVDSLDTLLCQYLPAKVTTTTTGTPVISPTSISKPEIQERSFLDGFYYGFGFWTAGIFLLICSIFSLVFTFNLCTNGDNWSKRLVRRCGSSLTALWYWLSTRCRRENASTNLRSSTNCPSNPVFFDALEEQRQQMNNLFEMDSLSSTLRRQRLFSTSQAGSCIIQQEQEEESDNGSGETCFETNVRLQADTRLANAIQALRNNASPKRTRSGVHY